MTLARALVTRVAGAALRAGTTLYGRGVSGERFDRHVAAELGLSAAAAGQLVDHLRARVTTQEYVALAAPFLLATRPPLRAALSYRVRRRASRPFLTALLSDLAAVLTYLGAAPRPDAAPCGGLL